MSHFRNSLTTGSAGNLSQRTFGQLGFLAVGLVWLIGFFGWFNGFGLPNNPGAQRWMLWTLIPYDLCDLIDPPVIAGANPWSWLALLQRTIQAEHLVYTASRPAHGLSQEFLVQQINSLATTLTHQMQSQQDKILEKTLEAMQLQQERSLSVSLEVMQNGQRDMVAKLNELNI